MQPLFKSDSLCLNSNNFLHSIYFIQILKLWGKTKQPILSKISKFDWTTINIRKYNIISPNLDLLGPNLGHDFFEVSALLHIRHCPKLQSCKMSRKTNNANLPNGKAPNYKPNFGTQIFLRVLPLLVRYCCVLSFYTI